MYFQVMILEKNPYQLTKHLHFGSKKDLSRKNGPFEYVFPIERGHVLAVHVCQKTSKPLGKFLVEGKSDWYNF